MTQQPHENKHWIEIFRGTWEAQFDPGNLMRLCKALDGQVDRWGREQIVNLHPGVGARSSDSQLDRLLGGAMAVGLDDFASQSAQAIAGRFQINHAVSILGFSRGNRVGHKAALALPELYPYPAELQGGVMLHLDPVSAEGNPYLDDAQLPHPHYLEKTLVILAEDERRAAFRPTPVEASPRVETITHKGAHADIGGSTPGPLADSVLELALTFLEENGLGVNRPHHLKPDPQGEPIHHPDFLSLWPPRRGWIRGPRRDLSRFQVA